MPAGSNNRLPYRFVGIHPDGHKVRYIFYHRTLRLASNTAHKWGTRRGIKMLRVKGQRNKHC